MLDVVYARKPDGEDVEEVGLVGGEGLAGEDFEEVAEVVAAGMVSEGGERVGGACGGREEEGGGGGYTGMWYTAGSTGRRMGQQEFHAGRDDRVRIPLGRGSQA
jgi:hypothetical protein